MISTACLFAQGVDVCTVGSSSRDFGDGSVETSSLWKLEAAARMILASSEVRISSSWDCRVWEILVLMDARVRDHSSVPFYEFE